MFQRCWLWHLLRISSYRLFVLSLLYSCGLFVLVYFDVIKLIYIEELLDCFIVILAVYFLHDFSPYAAFDIFHNYLFLFT